MTVAELNLLDRQRFVDRLGAVFEHSPWVAEAAWPRRPFASLEALHAAMVEAVRAATPERQLALVRAHPELAGREAQAGGLTAASSGEQGRLGFDALCAEELARMRSLNRRYREKHGFPCIVALRRHASRASVLAEMARRLENDPDAELANALAEVAHIARGRLERLLEA